MLTRVLILGKVLQVHDSIYYTACKTCYSKIHYTDDARCDSSSVRKVCLKCGARREAPDIIQRFRLNLHITDGYHNGDVTVFGTQLEHFLGASAHHLHSYLEWMQRNYIDSKLLNTALEQVFCDNWFLFGFKVSQQNQNRPANLSDIIGSSENRQTQCGTDKQSVIAWQMTQVGEKRVSDLTVITALRQLVHDKMRQRYEQDRTINQQKCRVPPPDESSSTGISTISFAMYSARNSELFPTSQNCKQPASKSGIDLSNNSTVCHSSNFSGSFKHSNTKHIGLGDCGHVNTGSSQRISDSNRSSTDSNILLHSRVHFENSSQSPLNSGVNYEHSIELQREGTQEMVQSVLGLDFNTIDFSKSFNNSHASGQSSRDMSDTSCDITRDVTDVHISKMDDAKVSNSHFDAPLTGDKIEASFGQDEDDTYYQLYGGLDGTIDVVRQFKEACDATQQTAARHHTEVGSVKHRCSIQFRNSSEPVDKTDLQNALSIDENEDSLNDSSLLLHCDQFDSENGTKQIHVKNEFTINNMMDRTPNIVETSEETNHLKSDSLYSDSINDSSLLLCAVDDASKLMLDKSALETRTANEESSKVGVSTQISHIENNKSQSLEMCPYSEDLEAFLNDTTRDDLNDVCSEKRNTFNLSPTEAQRSGLYKNSNSVVTECSSTNKTQHVKISSPQNNLKNQMNNSENAHPANDNNDLPYSEDLDKFLDMNNDSMNISETFKMQSHGLELCGQSTSVDTNVDIQKKEYERLHRSEHVSVKTISSVKVFKTMVKDIPVENTEKPNVCDNKIIEETVASETQLDLLHSEDLNQFLEDMNADSMNVTHTEGDDSIENAIEIVTTRNITRSSTSPNKVVSVIDKDASFSTTGILATGKGVTHVNEVTRSRISTTEVQESQKCVDDVPLRQSEEMFSQSQEGSDMMMKCFPPKISETDIDQVKEILFAANSEEIFSDSDDSNTCHDAEAVNADQSHDGKSDGESSQSNHASFSEELFSQSFSKNDDIKDNLNKIAIISDISTLANQSMLDSNSCLSNASEDLFGDSFDDRNTLDAPKLATYASMSSKTHQSSPHVHEADKPKSVNFATKLIQRELISNLDRRMQTTPYRTPKNIRRRSSLRIHMIENNPYTARLAKSITFSPCLEVVSTPSPDANALFKHNSTVLQSTPLILDDSNISLFSSPDTSVIIESQNKHPPSSHSLIYRSLPDQLPSEYDSEASLFSNDDSVQTGIDTGYVNVRHCDDIRSTAECSTSSDESDFIPCSQAICRARKFLIS